MFDVKLLRHNDVYKTRTSIEVFQELFISLNNDYVYCNVIVWRKTRNFHVYKRSYFTLIGREWRNRLGISDIISADIVFFQYELELI